MNNMRAPLIDREVFFGNPEISGGQISPDGEYISFIKAYKGVRNIWLKKREEEFEKAKPISCDEIRPIGSYFWSRNSDKILYVQDKGGDENFHLYAIDVNAALNTEGFTVPKDLSPDEGVRVFIIHLPKNQKNKIYIGLNKRDPAWHDVFCVDIDSGERELVLQNDLHFADVCFDPDDKIQLLARTKSDAGTELLRRNVNGEFEVFLSSTHEEQLNLLKINRDGDLYLSHNLGDTNLLGLYRYNLGEGSMHLVEEDPNKKVDLHNVLFSDKTEELLGTNYFDDKPSIYWKDENFRRDYEFLYSELGTTDIHLVSMDEQENFCLIFANSDVDPGTAWLFCRSDRSLRELYKPRPNVPVEHMSTMTPIRYNSLDGLEIQAYLSLPKSNESGNLPAVILVHGGPWARDFWSYNSWVQFLTNRGYVVIQANFRGSTGFGKAFLNAGNGEWGAKMQDDISAAANFLVKKGIADKDRIAIMGGSYGGYAVLAGLAFTPELYRCGVSIVGPSNLFTLLESIPPYWEQVREMFHIRMGNPTTDEGKKQLRAKSPYFHASNIKAALLIGQGDNDPRVKTAESNQIARAMRDNGLPFEYLNFPDEGHGFAHPHNNMAFLAVVERFLAKHIGGRYQEDIPGNLRDIINKVTVDPSTL